MPAESPYIVEFKHITKRFPKVVANDDISLQIRQGEIFALLGENGAGKSTLMSILFGLYEPDEGEIFIRGAKESIPNPNHATQLNIGMVHQHFRLVQNQSITENIILGSEPIKRKLGIFSTIDMHSAEKEIVQLSKQYGLEVDPSQKIEDVTVSVRQRVEILKMLYRNAEILIFDEPTAVLTPRRSNPFFRSSEAFVTGVRPSFSSPISLRRSSRWPTAVPSCAKVSWRASWMSQRQPPFRWPT